MGFLDSIIVPKDERNKKVQPAKTTSTKFPSADSNEVFGGFDEPETKTKPKFKNSEPTQSSGQISNEHLTKFSDMYQKGFDSLNQNGYDFYEFFQAVVHGGVDNPQIYSMAMAMGAGMDKSINKDTLLSQADFYINEINKVYGKYVESGKTKKEEFLTQKETENSALVAEVANLKEQLEALQFQIKDRETKLSLIGNKFQPLLGDIESKLMANDFAKNKIITAIESVKNGIIKNLK